MTHLRGIMCLREEPTTRGFVNFSHKKMRFTQLAGIPNEKFQLFMLTNTSINKEKF